MRFETRDKTLSINKMYHFNLSIIIVSLLKIQIVSRLRKYNFIKIRTYYLEFYLRYSPAKKKEINENINYQIQTSLLISQNNITL